MGLILVSGLAIATILARRRDGVRTLLAPWIMLQVYAAGNALLTAVFRSGLPDGPDQWSRYATVPALFWIGALGMTGLLAWRRPPTAAPARMGGRLAWALVVVGLALAMHARGRADLRTLVERAARQPLAARALVEDVWDAEALRAVTDYPEEVRAVRDFMRRMGHVPFDGAPEQWQLPPVERRSG